MSGKVFNVLFLCTGNSARSIFAEKLVERLGQNSFQGFSAGSNPKGSVHPLTLDELKINNFDIDGLRSKDWSEFSGDDAPTMDFVFTVCDKAAAETCPVWIGQPMTAHWGIADPAAVEGNPIEKKAAFHRAYREIHNRISVFVNLPIRSLDKLKLQTELDKIGKLDSPNDE